MPFLIEFMIALSVTALLLGSFFDLRTGEIPEKVSYGFIALALITSIAESLASSNPSFFAYSLLAGAGFFSVGFVLFYLGQWGGGDVKLMGGIGCSLGYLSYANHLPQALLPYYATYFINMGYIAFPYVLVYGMILGARNRGTGKEFLRYFGSNKTRAVLALLFIPSILATYLHVNPMALIYLLLPPMFVAALYLRAVETVALQEPVDVNRIREGDVVAEDLVVEGQKIMGKRDIEGFHKEDIAKVLALAAEGKIPGRIVIKRGIKFAPVLLFTYVSVVYAGSFLEMTLKALT